MSSFTVFSAVSKALRSVLWDAISQEAPLQSVVPNEAAIVFLNPTDTARDSSNRLSIWLYQVTENEFLRNAPPVRVDRSNPPAAGGRDHRLAPPPLSVNLHFLVTPFGETPEGNLLLLGKVMEVFYDNANIIMVDENDNVFEELRIMISRLTLEELSRVWEALIEPYRLSVCYEVRVMDIDSRRVMSGARIVNVEHGYSDKLLPEGI
jgi:hypothetical protein